MALSGDALQAILAATTEANRQAMVTVGETLATSLNQKSTEDQARTDALMKMMQDQLEKQDKVMQAMLMHLGRFCHPEGSLLAKDLPEVDEFKRSSVADENAQSDFLIMFAQICAHMEATGKLTAQIKFPGLPPSARIHSCIVGSGCSIHMFSDQNQLSHLNCALACTVADR